MGIRGLVLFSAEANGFVLFTISDSSLLLLLLLSESDGCGEGHAFVPLGRTPRRIAGSQSAPRWAEFGILAFFWSIHDLLSGPGGPDGLPP